MKPFYILFLFSLFSCAHSIIDKSAPIDLKPFSTDGCTLHPDGIPFVKKDKWLHCCFTHDVDYWIGGVELERNRSDLRLGQCVKEASNTLHGFMMKWGTRIGGKPNGSFPWRWGYGWNKNRKYNPLDKTLRKKVLNQFKSIKRALTSHDYELNSDQLKYIDQYLEDLKSKLEISQSTLEGAVE